MSVFPSANGWHMESASERGAASPFDYRLGEILIVRHSRDGCVDVQGLTREYWMSRLRQKGTKDLETHIRGNI